MKILLVDDSPTTRRIQAISMRGMGHVVIEAESGEEALQALDHLQPDAIFLDIEMPGMNGYETAIDIRALDEPVSSVPIIFLSSNSEIEAVRRAIASGGDDYLVKPVDEPRLLAKIAGLERHTAVRTQLAAMQRELNTLRASARDNASLDPLTGCLTQDAFIAQLGHLWQDALRIHQPISLLMIDVDALGAYNDALGHDAGDAAVRAIAEVMCQEAKRPSDAIGRTEHADFAALFPGIDVNGAVEIAERIRSTVHELGFPHPSSDTAQHLTISIGIAVIVPESTNGSRRLLDEANRALFDAKDAGRNCALLNPMSLMR
ncbi:MAG: diguanylate cyclase [Gammaproteobacteria bacterium]|nr:diguanylate cyclase [Gammaproteobacteria bacterium]MCP5137047.1 diguanylate cyclase [Gammaproteobacteria bacterium]